MPLQPPPGFEAAFAADCPSCGIPVGEHKSVEDHHEHLTGWLSDPDRSFDDILQYAIGVLAGLGHCIHLRLPAWAISQIITRHFEQLLEVQKRRAPA